MGKISLAIILVFCGSVIFTGSLLAKEDVFATIETAMLKDAYRQAAQGCVEIISARYGPAIKSKAYYLLGLCLLKEGKYEHARKQFNNVLSKYPSSIYRDDAKLGIADSYFLNAERQQANKLYQQFIRDFPRSELASVARMHLEQSVEGKNLDNSYFSVQVGCFANKKNALSLYDRLAEDGYQVFILDVPSDDLYHVRVGKFSTRLEAEFLEQRLKGEGYSTKVCP